jgi:hypothetical protein
MQIKPCIITVVHPNIENESVAHSQRVQFGIRFSVMADFIAHFFFSRALFRFDSSVAPFWKQ